jgi:hypothetical protein
MNVNSKLVVLLIIAVAVSAALEISLGAFTAFYVATGQFQIGNAAPAVNYIYINSQLASDYPSDATVNPIENTTSPVYIKVTITDNNGDCEKFTSNNGTAYICTGYTTVCDSTTANHTVNLAYNATDGKWGPGGIYCNLSGPMENFQFYETNGTWRINVSVTDGINTSSHSIKNWTYSDLRSIFYAEPSHIVNMGVMTVGQWNNGTGEENVTNVGNIVVTNLLYIIDDDAASPDDTGNLPQKYMNESNYVTVSFVYPTGVITCTDPNCQNQNATLPILWHIEIPPGLLEDTYNNTIEVNTEG